MQAIFKSYEEHFRALTNRQEALFDRYQFDSMIISSGLAQLQFSDDMEHPFKVNPYFKVWIPLAENPNCYLLLQRGLTPKLLYYKPVDYWSYWPNLPSENWINYFDCVNIESVQEVSKHLPTNSSQTVFIGEQHTLEPNWGIAQINPPQIIAYLDFYRGCKSEYEQLCIKEANRIGARGHQYAKQAFLEGASELEVHYAFLRGCITSEHQLPYDTIVGFDRHAAVLHYHQKDSENRNAKSMLIDAGAPYRGYASDITRTYSFDVEFTQLIEIFDKLQLAIIDNIKIGKCYGELHHQAHQKICQFMVDYEFVSCSLEQCLDFKLSKWFFPHGLGHFLGVQVHDKGGFLANDLGDILPKLADYPALRLNRVIEANQVFTIEPGFYFIDSLLTELKQSLYTRHINWKAVDYFKAFGGIRIEDNVLVTSTGTENFTRDALTADC